MKPTLLVMILLALCPAAYAQEDVAALLVVEDEGYPGHEITERLGRALYTRFLESGAYTEVVALTGADHADGEALAAAIADLAARHDAVDLFLSAHGRVRDVERWQALLPPESRKLRLVYSTGCESAETERETWGSLGAHTVVAFTGLNNPVVAFPLFLSRWLSGATVGEAVAEGQRESELATSFVLSLPGFDAEFGTVAGELALNRPQITGDAALRVGSQPRPLPVELRYDRAKGGPLGLVLRALAGRFQVEGAEVSEVLARLSLNPSALGISPDRLASIAERLSIERISRDRARLVLRLKAPLEIPLEQGATLILERKLTLEVKTFDPLAHKIHLAARGVWVKIGGVRFPIRNFRLHPRGDEYVLKATTFGIGRTFGIGGTPPGVARDGAVARLGF